MKYFSKRFAPIFLLLFMSFSPASSASDWIYHAKEGDTFWDLCLMYTNKRGCWLELGKYNGVRNDRAIPLGREIRIPVEWLVAPPVVGQVTSVSGAVDYHLNPSAPGAELLKGQDLHLGARLKSGAGSARLQFGAGNELLLRERSILDLDTMSGPAVDRYSAELGLPSGAVEVKIQPNRKSRFRITTPAAIAAVRGTEYRVDSLGSAGESMRSEVLSGMVEVASDKSAVDVPGGYGVAATKGEAPGKPRELLPAPSYDGDYSAAVLPVAIGWERNPDAVAWVLDLMEEGASGALLQSFRTTEPRWQFENVEQGCYKLNVRAVDAEGFNGLNSVTALCIVSRPASVNDLSGISSDSASNSMRVSWSAVAGAERYRVEFATDPDFKNIVDRHDAETTAYEFQRSTEVVFYLRVIAVDGAGNESRAGVVQEFTPPQRTPWGVLALFFTILVLAM